MTHQNLSCSEKHVTPTLILDLKNLPHHCHPPMSPGNLPEMVKEDWKKEEHINAQMLLPCPTNKHAGDAQYRNFL